MATTFAPSVTEIAPAVEAVPETVAIPEPRARLPRAEPDVTAESTGPPLYRLSIEQYEAMAEAGILDNDDRVELVDGLLVKKMTKYGPHRVATGLASDTIAAILPQGWHVSKEDPVRIPGRAGEPEPDISVVRGGRRDYLKRHPERTEVALIIEVAESSLDFDRGAKLRMYAGGGFPIYWILNVVDRQLEVYTEPSGDAEPMGYRQTAVLKPGDSVTFAIEGAEMGPIAVADLLP